MLTGIDPIRVCVAYEIDGKRVELPPATQRGWARAKPIYEEMPGWRSDSAHARTLDELPRRRAATSTSCRRWSRRPIALVSIGAGREQTIRLGELF